MPFVTPVVELADRRSDDVDVSLMWARRSGRLWVKVTSRHTGRTARIDATPSNALDVFRHPYAYTRELVG
jgi:hypothetical protein